MVGKKNHECKTTLTLLLFALLRLNADEGMMKGVGREISKDEFFFKLSEKINKNQNLIVKHFFKAPDITLSMIDFIQIVEGLNIIDRSQIPDIYNKLDPTGSGLSFKDFIKFFPEANKNFQEQIRTVAFQIHKSYIRLLKNFKEYDINRGEKLPYIQVRSILSKSGIECSHENLKELVLMLEADTNNFVNYVK